MDDVISVASSGSITLGNMSWPEDMRRIDITRVKLRDDIYTIPADIPREIFIFDITDGNNDPVLL